MLTMRTRILVLLTTLLISAPVIAADETSEPTLDELLAHPDVGGALAIIDAWIDGRKMFERIPGISVGIVRDQDLLWTNGYGYSNLETRRPADADTLYSICSISKLFTAVGIMQLRDQDKLRLSDPVNDHLDWFDIEQAYEGSGPVTIEGMMTHSSGLPRESDFPYWIGPDFPFPTREEMIERLGAQETLYPSQHYFQYSNLGWSLAGEIIRERSGQDYDEYMREQILDPLELESTRTYYPDDLRGEQLAIGYTGLHRDLQRDPVKPFFTRGITAAAGFTSSVNDLASFASWQFRLLENGGKEVLSANTLREMQRVHWVDPDWETTWGLGFNVRRDEDTTYVSHGGGCPGYITSFTMVPKQKIAAVVLTNAGDGPAGSMAVEILETIGPALEEAGTPPEDETPDLSMYEGNFQAPPWGGEVAVRQWGDRLVVIDIPGTDLSDSMIRLEHDGGNTFTRLTDDDERREPWVFELGEDGKATRIVRHSGFMSRVE
jgi:CubicO group peptidase (beta-lactamase class C family)